MSIGPDSSTALGRQHDLAGVVQLPIRLILRLEGLTILLGSIVAYSSLHTPWWIFAAAFLLPDLAALGFLVSPRTGAILYNAAHTLICPLVFGVVGHVFALPTTGAITFIWIAHIGFDRGIGYGLRYPDAPQKSHLGWLGQAKRGRS
jgi:hypothetical protein